MTLGKKYCFGVDLVFVRSGLLHLPASQKRCKFICMDELHTFKLEMPKTVEVALGVEFHQVRNPICRL